MDFETAQKSFLSVERKKSFRGKSKNERSLFEGKARKKEVLNFFFPTFFKERSGNLLKTIGQSEAEVVSTI